ncbi:MULTISPECIES: PTS transporter subunit IIC [Eubacterium]|uniref:Phosphotransferase system EIIC domain-containing protein n=2 Tax=Eubacterium TaxID=1730 RepID=A0A1H4DV77_9FIRM|nr:MULTISPECIES: PTS sugar transporter subunit IIC [Eubacterium]ABC88400.1 unknown [Eubacterium barkeri]SDX95824.1 hypothetical protein SAMN04488579_11212 [Eubacterium barkeri]SEA76399.1 hypothetical protein SAMN04515656_12811 [Eubacterium aggregans]
MENKEKNAVLRFLEKKNVIISFKRYGIDALSAMALGLFASLLIGTIITTIGQNIGNSTLDLATATNVSTLDYMAVKLVEIGGFATSVTGCAMAISIGYALQAPPLVLYSLAAVGQATNKLGGAGGPMAVLVVAILAAELGKIVSKETKVDIIVTPFVTIAGGIIIAMAIAPAIGAAASSIGFAIMWATDFQPFIMGVLVSVICGICLTLPISSAAICAALGLVGLAGGAGVAGCCAQMVGFAVMSYPENGFGGLIAQGIGTSMLQVPNILRNWKIWIPPIVASAITGPIATCIFKLKMNGAPVSSGMGTSGLVGQIGVITGWASPSENALALGEAAVQAGAWDWIGLILISFVLPAILTLAVAIPLRKIGWIQKDDLKIDMG